MIFLSLRFYAKSILVILEMQNLPFLTRLEVLNFDYYEFLHFLKTEIYQIYGEKWQKRQF